jgi:hypothetical protein
MGRTRVDNQTLKVKVMALMIRRVVSDSGGECLKQAKLECSATVTRWFAKTGLVSCVAVVRWALLNS